MADLKTGAKFIDQDPPLADQETKSVGRKIIDYLAYLKERLNFIFSNYGRRLTDADGHINELVRTAEEMSSTIYDPETGESRIQQNADAISVVVDSENEEIKAASIVAAINDSGSTVVIDADHIDLDGYVTFTNLSTSGQTTINGANITTGLIKDAANKNSWNLNTGTFRITEGSVNITTSSSTYDQIVLNHSNFGSAMRADGMHATLTQNGDTFESFYSAGSFNYYKNDKSTAYIGTSGSTVYMALGNISGSPDGELNVYGPTTKTVISDTSVQVQSVSDANQRSIFTFDPANGGGKLQFCEGTNGGVTMELTDGSTGLVFRNTSGTQTASYPNSLTASRALVTGSGGAVTTSSVTSTELGYLSGVTSNIQTQLNNKGNPTHISGGTTLSATTAYKYSGVSFTVPAGKYFVCTAHAYYSAVSPAAVCISSSSTSLASGAMQIEGLVDSQNTRARVTWSGYLSSATTYYIWAKAASAGNLGIGVDGFYL